MADARGRQVTRRVLRIAFPCALLAILVVIWLLTIQPPRDTMALSDTWTDVLVRLVPLSHERASWIVRKVVHTVEFFPVGLFVTLSMVVWTNPGARRSSRYGRHMDRSHAFSLAAAVTCLLLSLGDQLHKTMVPGREFDALDMCFDAVGYLLAIWIVMRVWRWKKLPRRKFHG